MTRCYHQNPSRRRPKPPPQIDLQQLESELLALEKVEPKQRGVAFEKFLKKFFDAYGLAAHSAFNLVGEQIDGSFQLAGQTYIIEAKWHKEPIGNRELLELHAKVEAKLGGQGGYLLATAILPESVLRLFQEAVQPTLLPLPARIFLLSSK